MRSVVKGDDNNVVLSKNDDGGCGDERRLLLGKSRRSFLVQSMIMVATTCGTAVGDGHAIEPRNEALCSTGFFTNIAQYYCTDIGNISDEGKIKDLSTNQEMATDSLLSKLIEV